MIERIGGPRGEILRETEPIAIYKGYDGEPVPFYPGGPLGIDWVDYLAFRFEDWLVLVYDYKGTSASGWRMSERDRATLARSLQGHTTNDGYLALAAAPPLELAKAGKHAGPEIRIGTGRPSIQLAPGANCRRAEANGVEDLDPTGRGMTWCDHDTDILVRVAAERGVLRELQETLQIRAATRNRDD